MANIKSAKKRILVAQKKTLQNKVVKNVTKIAIKDYLNKVDSKDKSAAEEAFKKASKAIDKAVTKGVLHKNNAARKKSRLAHKLKTISA